MCDGYGVAVDGVDVYVGLSAVSFYEGEAEAGGGACYEDCWHGFARGGCEGLVWWLGRRMGWRFDCLSIVVFLLVVANLMGSRSRSSDLAKKSNGRNILYVYWIN